MFFFYMKVEDLFIPFISQQHPDSLVFVFPTLADRGICLRVMCSYLCALVWKLKVSVRHLSQLLPYVVFETVYFTGAPWFSLSRLTGSKPQRSLVPLPTPGMIGLCYHALPVTWVLGSELRPSCLHGKCLTGSQFVCHLLVHSPPCRFLSVLGYNNCNFIITPNKSIVTVNII